MKGFDILHLKSAVKDRNRFPELSRTHETSMDIGQISVLFNEELVPSDEFPVKGKFFARTAPLVKPTFGRVLFKTVSMFVPYHQVAEDAEAFIDGKTSWLGQTPVLRYITAYDLAFLFTQTSFGYVTTTGASATNYDIVIQSSGTIYYLLTNRGRYFNKILNQLGYFIPENIDSTTGSYWVTKGEQKKFSAYALLAFFKGYNDWMSQSQRYNISQLSYALLNIRQNKAFSGYTTNGHIGYQVLDLFFKNLLLNYDNDYFTSAWQNNNSPLNAAENITTPTFPSTFGGMLNSSVGTFGSFPLNTAGTVATLDQRGLNILKAFDDWVRRNNYAGSRDVQQIYARFGIKVDDYRTHYAHVVGTSEQYVNVGDVTATAETSQAILGDYAGKAVIDCDVDIEYKSSDYGLLMVLGYITVKPQMAFGFDRKNLRTEPLDWYNPEFDGVGGDPITYRELFESCKVDPSSDVSTGDDVFGFTERYNSYRYGRDQITGDFKVFKDMDVWHCGRDLSVLRAGGTMIAQSSSMNTLPQTDSEYNRIFSVQSGDVDHFYFICQFEVNALRPMLSSSQVPQLGTGDTVVPRNGNVIN